MQSRQATMLYLEEQSVKSMLMDCMEAAHKQIAYLEALLHRKTASSECVMHSLDAMLNIVQDLDEERFE